MSEFGKLQAPTLHRGINWVGLYTLYVKECRRFINIAAQTLVAPAVINLLYFTVFSLALKTNATDPSAFEATRNFLAPGIIMMSIMQNAFASVTSAILISKIQGAFVDLLLSPITPFEMTAGFLLSGMTRGVLVGISCLLPLLFFVSVDNANWLVIFYFALMGSLWMANLGLLCGILAQKFDHMNAFTNFIVTPLIFLSGTFYSVQGLHPLLQKIAHADPFFFIINGFRHGFLGESDTDLHLTMLVILGINLVLALVSWLVIRSGYRLKS
ncbi:MAG: ABC transporter permease [Hydrotalea sp.]|nr:ABC transporter permease [Hydrotalea sp.]